MNDEHGHFSIRIDTFLIRMSHLGMHKTWDYDNAPIGGRLWKFRQNVELVNVNRPSKCYWHTFISQKLSPIPQCREVQG